MSAFGTIIQIGDILVSEDVVLEYFACDYGRCKGCCCVIGDRKSLNWMNWNAGIRFIPP